LAPLALQLYLTPFMPFSACFLGGAILKKTPNFVLEKLENLQRKKNHRTFSK
jgi:hypothetical protein